MTWVDSIQELDFYSRGASDYCYCDLLIHASDLTIQGILRNDSVSADLKLYMYTPDGVTQIAEVTTYFDWFISNITGRSFFTARLRYFPEIMCNNRCFILRAIVDDLSKPDFGQGQPRFNRMTQQYCLADCCMMPANVTITGGNVTQHDASLPTTISSPKDIMCRPLLRIEVGFDCVDRYTGDYWHMPPNLSYVNGSTGAIGMFKFTKVVNLAGTILDKPREIKRNVSLNCRVQRTETTRLYEVQSFEQFPLWKFQEISDMLHAQYLQINDRQYIFAGGTPFEPLYPKRICKRYFRLKFGVQDCTQYQLFGCAEKCAGINIKYYAFTNQADTYYDDSGRRIGDFDDVVIWFNTGGGGSYGKVVTPPPLLPGEFEVPFETKIDWSAREVPPSEPNPPVARDYYKILEVTGDNLPSYIYSDSIRPSGRIYAQELINGDYNALFGIDSNYVPCAVPVPGVPAFTDMVCDSPVIGIPTFTDNCKLPVLGIPVYGDLDDDVPVGTVHLELEDGSGLLLSEDGDFLTHE